MDISIRKAKPEELGDIQAMNRKLFEWDFDRDPSLNINWPYEDAGETYFRNKITGESGVCFVAEASEDLLGYVAAVSIKKSTRPRHFSDAN